MSTASASTVVPATGHLVHPNGHRWLPRLASLPQQVLSQMATAHSRALMRAVGQRRSTITAVLVFYGVVLAILSTLPMLTLLIFSCLVSARLL